MAISSYVPADPRTHPRRYESSPRRGNGWHLHRPGEVVPDAMPEGGLYGNHGPDIGYAYKIVHRLRDKVKVSSGENHEDAEAGAIAVAMRRAALLGRAPILADLDVTAMRVITNNPAKYGGLEGFGLDIADRVPSVTAPNPENIRYLRTKQERMGHLLEGLDDYF